MLAARSMYPLVVRRNGRCTAASLRATGCSSSPACTCKLRQTRRESARDVPFLMLLNCRLVFIGKRTALKQRIFAGVLLPSGEVKEMDLLSVHPARGKQVALCSPRSRDSDARCSVLLRPTSIPRVSDISCHTVRPLLVTTSSLRAAMATPASLYAAPRRTHNLTARRRRSCITLVKRPEQILWACIAWSTSRHKSVRSSLRVRQLHRSRLMSHRHLSRPSLLILRLFPPSLRTPPQLPHPSGRTLNNVALMRRFQPVPVDAPTAVRRPACPLLLPTRCCSHRLHPLMCQPPIRACTLLKRWVTCSKACRTLI